MYEQYDHDIYIFLWALANSVPAAAGIREVQVYDISNRQASVDNAYVSVRTCRKFDTVWVAVLTKYKFIPYMAVKSLHMEDSQWQKHLYNTYKNWNLWDWVAIRIRDPFSPVCKMYMTHIPSGDTFARMVIIEINRYV
jgi:hypothetical protein